MTTREFKAVKNGIKEYTDRGDTFQAALVLDYYEQSLTIAQHNEIVRMICKADKNRKEARA